MDGNVCTTGEEGGDVMFLSMEYAAIIKTLITLTAIPVDHVYYDNQQEGFQFPALYFPPVELDTFGHSLGAYRATNTAFVKVFAENDQDAMEYGQKIVHGIKGKKNQIKEVDEDGAYTEKTFRISDPLLRLIDNGAAQIQLVWNPVYDYDRETGNPFNTIEIETILKGG
jgi:hypothetical protein